MESVSAEFSMVSAFFYPRLKKHIEAWQSEPDIRLFNSQSELSPTYNMNAANEQMRG